MNEGQPIFQQIMERIESDIAMGVYKVDELIISTTQISKVYSVNHTTAVKAVSKLVDAEILYKKRGIGMCVAEGARDKIIARRRDAFLNHAVVGLLKEAKVLGITVDELINIIKNKEGENKSG